MSIGHPSNSDANGSSTCLSGCAFDARSVDLLTTL